MTTSGLENRRVCFRCIGEDFLRNRLKREGQRLLCSYCGLMRKGFSLTELAEVVESVIEEHYQRTAEEPSAYEYALQREGLSGLWFRDGEPIADVIKNLCETEQQIAEDVRKVLYRRHYDRERLEMGEEGPFDEGAHYEESGVRHGELKDQWEQFERSLKTEVRYFSQSARAALNSTFAGIGEHATWDGKPVVVECGPGKEISALYRARVFQSDADTVRAMERPDVEVGPPPPARAMAGRMNARGISVFYGALDAATALAEVRPPVGSRVLVVRFEILRPVRLLDVEALRSLRTRGSLFDPSFTERLQKAKFLQGLSDRISAPVMPDDEPLEYLPTQAVADFLASEVNPRLDGIIYRSVQTGDDKLNIALFHHASRVQTLDIPKGTTFNTTMYREDDDGALDLECHVMEEVPPPPPQEPAPNPHDLMAINPVRLPDEFLEEYDAREVTLKPDVASATLHLVKATAITTEHRIVGRHRINADALRLNTPVTVDVPPDTLPF